MLDAPETLALAAVLAAAALWLMLPRGRDRPNATGTSCANLAAGPAVRRCLRRLLAEPGRAAGAVLGLASLGLFASRLPWPGNGLDGVIVLMLSGADVVAAAATVTSRKPAHAAIGYGLVILATAGLFLTQGAPLPAAATLAVHAGAILGAFPFVRSVAQPEDRPYDRTSTEPLVCAVAGAAIVGLLAIALGRAGNVFGERDAAVGEIALLEPCQLVGALMFGIGLVGFVARRNVIVTVLSAGILLQGASLGLVAWGRFYGDFGGQVLVLAAIAAAACEAAVALALILRSGGAARAWTSPSGARPTRPATATDRSRSTPWR